MSGAKGLKGLRTAAEATVLREVRLTPELQAAVLEHVAELALPDREPPARPTRRWLGGAYVVAAAALTVAVAVVLSRPAPQPPPGAVNAPAAAGHASVSMAAQPQGQAAAAGKTEAPVPASPPAGPAKMAIDGGGQSGIHVTVMDAAGVPGPTPPALAASPDQARGASATAGGVEAQPGRKIIMNGDYSIEVADVRAAADQLRSLTQEAGGYVADATVTRSGPDSWSAHLTLRIPAAAFAASTQQLRQLGRVLSEREWTQDVTDQYTDLERRIAIQQEQEKRLQELAARAATFDDWNRVTSQMNETRAQIESMQGKLKQLSNQVDYAIVNVSLTQAQPGAPPLPANPTFGQQAAQAFARSWHRLGETLRQGLVALAGLLPTLLLLLPCLALLAWLAWRWRRAGRTP